MLSVQEKHSNVDIVMMIVDLYAEVDSDNILLRHVMGREVCRFLQRHRT